MPATVTADGIGRTRLDLGFGRWGEVFATTVAAMIDRLVHHARVITSTVVRDVSLMEISGGSAQQRLNIPTSNATLVNFRTAEEGSEAAAVGDCTTRAPARPPPSSKPFRP